MVDLPAGRQGAEMKYFVYIIQSINDGFISTGMTNNVQRRMEEHNLGKLSTPTTYGRGPFRLVYSEECASRAIARIREKYWKYGIGREQRKKMMSGIV